MFNKKKSSNWSDKKKPYTKERRDDFKELCNATCNKCHKECKVPFKPTGSKPVFCRDCFKKDFKDLDKSFKKGPRFDRGDRRESRDDRRPAAPNNNEVVKQLKDLNLKMDQLLRTLDNR